MICYFLSFSYIICKQFPFESYPIDFSSEIRIIIDKDECLKEIENIYKKDFKSNFTNPYIINSDQEKLLNRTLIQINKKINKYIIYVTKNFSGIRWISSKSVESKNILNNYFTDIIKYLQNNFFSYYNNVPEFLYESYQFFFFKISEIKKIFQKFYFFKGLKKFNLCYAKYYPDYNHNKFGDNIINGNMNIKELMTILRDFVRGVIILTKSYRMDDIGKAIRIITLSLRGIP